MAKRARAKCSAEELAGALAPFVTGRRWLSYSENPNSKVNRMVIVQHKDLINRIKETFGTLSLTAHVTEQAFVQISDDVGDRIALKNEHKKDWARVMARRLRTMLRHTSQSIVKKCSWTTGLRVKDETTQENTDEKEDREEEKADEDLEVEPDDGAPDQWLVGFSWEHFEAWRTGLETDPTRGKNPTKEVTNDLFCPDDDDATAMRARWRDGFTATLPELLQGQYNAAVKLQSKKAGTTTSAVLAAPRRSTGSIVKVSYRSERPGQENYRIMEDKKTITIVQLNKFGGDDQAAKALAIELGTALINEDISKEEIIKRRDRGLPNLGKKKKKRQAHDIDTTTTTAATTTPKDEARSPCTPQPRDAYEVQPPPKRRLAHDMRIIPRGLMSSSEELSPHTLV